MSHSRWGAGILLATVGAMAQTGCARDADLVLVGGKVWTGDAASATAVAARGGRIIAVGTDAEVLAYAGPGTTRIELGGRRLVPGLMDNHTHFIDGGAALAGVQLRDADSREEFVRRIGAFVRQHPGAWVLNGAWDHEAWGGEPPRRDWIDSVSGDTPVFVSRLDGHMALANTRALELGGVTADTPAPPGGEIVRDDGGRPTGLLKDEAMTLVARAIPAPTILELDRALDAAATHAVAHGVTHVVDMGTWDGLETYRRAAAAGRLPLRVYAAVPIGSWERMAEYVRSHGRGDDLLAWGAVKGFVDGSLGSTTAWFSEPYTDAPQTAGIMVTDTAALRAAILGADSAGLHVMVHAIGDRANDWLLEVYAEARARGANPGQRFRIEHAQHLHPQAMARFAELGVVPSAQPYHAIDDGRWAEQRIGPDRIRTTYAFRSLLDAGARLTFGSDWTVAPLDPLLGIYAAVTRRTIDGATPGGWVPEQRITVEEALRAYTSANAWADYRETDLGTIEVGKLADLVVLSDDILAIDPAAIAGVRVDITIVGGRVVYRADGV